MAITEEYRQSLMVKVSLGSILLDALEPGWESKIDLKHLRMESWTAEILSMIHPDAEDYMEAFQRIIEKYQGLYRPFYCSHFGFTLPDAEQHPDDIDTMKRFAVLTECWKCEVRARRKGKKP